MAVAASVMTFRASSIDPAHYGCLEGGGEQAKLCGLCANPRSKTSDAEETNRVAHDASRRKQAPEEA
jgi:hypothetical protein